MRLFSVHALLAALTIDVGRLHAVLRGPGGRYLLRGKQMPRSFAELVGVAAVLILGPSLRRSQRAALLSLPLRPDIREWLEDPRKGELFVIVPPSGLDPFPDDTPHPLTLSLDLGLLALDLRERLERLAVENPAWAAAHTAEIEVGWEPARRAPGPRRLPEIPDGATLRDLVEGS